MKSFFSILFSAILLVSHVYFTVGTHVCDGKAVETKVLLGHTTLGCNMPHSEKTLTNPEKTNNKEIIFKSIPCCKNEYHTVQSTNEFLKDANPITFNLEFLLSDIFRAPDSEISPRSNNQFIKAYVPPLIEKDIQTLFQTFLI